MEKLYFEIPSIARKEDAIDYIREFHEYQSDINGTGGLDRFIDNYEGGSKNWSRIIQEYQMKKKCLPGHSFWFGTRTGRLSA